MDSTTSIQVYTYADLRRVHGERLQAEGKSYQQTRNHDSALNQFIKAIGKSDSCECGQDFTEHFEANLTRFVEALTARGVSEASIANSVSFLRSIGLTFNAMFAGAIGSKSFAESLCALLQTHGVSQNQLVRDTGIAVLKISQWRHGAPPRKASINDIKKIERYFNLPSGTLLSKVDIRFVHDAAPDLETRKKHQALALDPYKYKEPNALVRSEWEELFKFYTAPYLTNGLQRNSVWRVKPIEKVACHKRFIAWWKSPNPKEVCVTATVNWDVIASFFGYLIRDSSLGGKGFSEETLSLAFLSDASLMLDYIEFKKNRSGKYTEEVKRTLGFITSLLRNSTGFLVQHPKYGVRLPVPVSEANWASWCENNRITLVSVYNDLKKGKHFQKGRDPREPVAKIIAEAHPIHILLQMVKRMERKLTLAQHSLLRAVRKRDVLLVKMLISNPLRVNHYSIMSYRKDNTGNLYQDSLGTWRLRFQPIDFKNQKGAASKDYDVALSRWIYKDVEEYITDHRPLMLHSETSDRFFLNSTMGSNGKWNFMATGQISDRLRKITREYIPGCPGFGPHAFRHIVATDYIKNNPNGFQVAANILHDKLATVMREYAHVKVADGFSHWTSYLDEQIDASGVDNE